MRIALLLACAACGDNFAEHDLAPVAFVDLDPDPDVVEVELVASVARHEYLSGKAADVWAFRDGARPGATAAIPGPLLDAKLGDRVIVHFKNELPEETTIHWHGLRVANPADGTTLSQMPVPPGASFDYEFTLIDSGLHWYHPHLRGDVQVEAGLYGPIRVATPDPIDVASDRVFVLDDVKLESTGKLSQRTDALDLMLGRQGNVVLVNGRTGATIDAAPGTRERWRFVNAANGRYFQLELAGHVFRVIGWDGGLVSEPYETARLLVAPGERYEVLVELSGEPGDALALQTVHYDRGHNIPDPGPIDLVAIELGARGDSAVPPVIRGDTVALPVDGTTPRRRFVLREDDTNPMQPVFTINDEAFPNVTPVEAVTGAIEVWDVENATEMDHPFHLHGMSFQILDAAGRPIAPLAWKDTVNVPRDTTLALAVRYGSTGHWMFHCHILEHAERGMMGHLHVR